MKRRQIVTTCLLLIAAVGTFAQHWTVNVRAWQYDMTAYFQLSVGGALVTDYTDYEVAAFCGDECRGVAYAQAVAGESPLLYMRIRSNVTDGETITFRVYRISSKEEILLGESIAFEPQSVVGTPGTPMKLALGSMQKGDANGDGAIDALDASLVLQYVAHKFGDENTGFNKVAADTNGDGEVDALDASLILQHAAKKIDLLTKIAD